MCHIAERGCVAMLVLLEILLSVRTPGPVLSALWWHVTMTDP